MVAVTALDFFVQCIAKTSEQLEADRNVLLKMMEDWITMTGEASQDLIQKSHEFSRALGQVTAQASSNSEKLEMISHKLHNFREESSTQPGLCSKYHRDLHCSLRLTCLQSMICSTI